MQPFNSIVQQQITMYQTEQITDIILERFSAILVIVNNRGQVEFVGPSVKKILGFEPNELLGEGWWQLTRDNEEERLNEKASLLNYLRSENNASDTFETLIKTANGGRKWILWNYTKGPDSTLVVIGNDITEHKITEELLETKNKELLAKNTDIIDSIQYATRIQTAILPDVNSIKKSFADAFVLYKPKDLVSGDFYFHFEKGNRVYIAAIDCTGHGVPGALMSIIANSILRDIIIKRNTPNASSVLKLVDEEIVNAFSKNGATINDGMDIALCIIDKSKNTLEFAGAFRPLIHIRNSIITEYKGNRYPIGFYQDVTKDFTSNVIDYIPGDLFYIFSDGYIDQFGGENEKKLNKTRFKELLLTVENMEMEEQEAFLEYSLLNWQQNIEQTDDIVVVGLKM